MATLRIAALLAAAGLSVHELRFMLGGSGSEAGHGYLPGAGILVAVALAVACAHLLVLWRGQGRVTAGSRPALSWLAASCCVCAVFVSQELAEGLLAHERTAGLTAVLSGGGWIALPLSLVLGAVVSLALRGFARVEELIVARARRVPRARVARRRPSAGPDLPGHIAEGRLGARAPPVRL